jgi:hypothetical protein
MGITLLAYLGGPPAPLFSQGSSLLIRGHDLALVYT